jgi:hypothetical protein
MGISSLVNSVNIHLNCRNTGISGRLKDLRRRISFDCNHSRGDIILRVTVDDLALKVEVIDDGPGIPENEIENLFKPYHRIQQDRLISGLGLGLAICKQIIEAHGGKIWIEPRPLPGAKFCFSLPVSPIRGSPVLNFSSTKTVSKIAMLLYSCITFILICATIIHL